LGLTLRSILRSDPDLVVVTSLSSLAQHPALDQRRILPFNVAVKRGDQP